MYGESFSQKAALLSCPRNLGLHEMVGVRSSLLPGVGREHCREDPTLWCSLVTAREAGPEALQLQTLVCSHMW